MFYKLDNNELLFSDSVEGPNYSLTLDNYQLNEYPVDGWYWFESKLDAENYLVTNAPRIYRYVNPSCKLLHFHAIDHNTMLDRTLTMIETLGLDENNRGLLLEKRYYNDSELVFLIEYTYERNQYSQYTGQELKLTWIREDGSPHPEVKRKGMEPLTLKRSKEITRNRRQSVVQLLENSVETLLLASGAGAEGLTLGRQLLREVSQLINGFVDSGEPDQLIAYLQQAEVVNRYPFLASEVAPQYSVNQYIEDYLTFD